MAVVIVATIVLLCSLNGKLGIAANGDWYIHIKSYHESEMSCACINILLEFKFKPLWYNIYIYIWYAERFQHMGYVFSIQIAMCLKEKVYFITVTLVFNGLTF